MFFDRVLKDELLESPQTAWPSRIAAALGRTGNSLAQAAEAAFAAAGSPR